MPEFRRPLRRVPVRVPAVVSAGMWKPVFPGGGLRKSGRTGRDRYPAGLYRNHPVKGAVPPGAGWPCHDVYGQSSAPGVDFNPQGSREPRQQNYPKLLHIPPNILCIMLFSPQFNQFSPFTQPAFTAFSSVFQVRISQAFHVSLAFAPGLKGSQLTETNSTYILHNPSFPAYILHAAKPLPPPPDTLSIQASFVPDIWHPA